MLLKRKRSDDELSFCSGAGGFSSPLRLDDGDTMMVDTDGALSPRAVLSPARSCTPSHLPSRTFKRLRNGRPSEEEVHQHTLKVLYQAAQQQPRPQHAFSPPAPVPAQAPLPAVPAAQSPPRNQPSLHSFWKVASPSSSASSGAKAASGGSPVPRRPSSAMSTSVSSVASSVDRSMICEDCGVRLDGEDAMMDGGYGFEAFIHTCSVCSKAVCFSCSVSNLGEQRRCLHCAGREKKRWIGGVGWTSGGVQVS